MKSLLINYKVTNIIPEIKNQIKPEFMFYISLLRSNQFSSSWLVCLKLWKLFKPCPYWSGIMFKTWKLNLQKITFTQNHIKNILTCISFHSKLHFFWTSVWHCGKFLKITKVKNKFCLGLAFFFSEKIRREVFR